MRVQNINISLNAMQTKEGHGEEKTNKKTFFAGDVGMGKSDLELRREQAQKQALKVVSDTFAGEKKLDEETEKRRLHMEELSEENVSLIEERKVIQEKLKSTELNEVDRKELEDALDEFDKRIARNEGMILGESMTIEATRIERLKSDPMLEAAKAAEELNLAAAEAFAEGVLNEAKETVEKKMEENKEQGKELQEKLEERQEALDESVKKSKERVETMTEQLEKNAENMNAIVTEVSHSQEEVNQQLEEIRRKMKVLEEDLKGAAMDEQW